VCSKGALSLKFLQTQGRSEEQPNGGCAELQLFSPSLLFILNLMNIILFSSGVDHDSIIMEEEIDPNYVPGDDEVIEYAKWLGMELDKDNDLFWIAREGLMAPLPKNWKPCKTKDTEGISRSSIELASLKSTSLSQCSSSFFFQIFIILIS
jgi:hypothetical protein